MRFHTHISASPFPLAELLAITPAMTNRIALGLGLFLVVAFALNFALGLEWHVYIARRLLDLIRLIAFWR